MDDFNICYTVAKLSTHPLAFIDRKCVQVLECTWDSEDCVTAVLFTGVHIE